jgi:hypothetical protein
MAEIVLHLVLYPLVAVVVDHKPATMPEILVYQAVAEAVAD